MLFNQKFDLIFSIGEDCACSSYLRRYNLQDYSYPFDWLTKATFKKEYVSFHPLELCCIRPVY